MTRAAQSRNGFFGFLNQPKQKRNLFGWSRKEKTAKRKKVSGGATEARGAGYRYALHKSDENFSEWMDRKDFGDEKGPVKQRLADAFAMGFDRGKKEIESKEHRAKAKAEKKVLKQSRRERKLADEADRKIEREMKEKGLRNPAVSARQYRLAEAALSGTARFASMPRKVAQEIVDRTPAKLRSEFMKGTGGTINGVRPSTGGTKARNLRGEVSRGSSKKKGYPKLGSFLDRKGKGSKKKNRRNPAADAAALSAKFHGRKATTQKRIIEPMHVHKHLMEIGPLVRLVIDTPTNKVAVLNFNTSDPKKIVYLSSSEKDPKTGKIVGKQLYLRGGDQEVNLKGLGMDSALWIRDKMELGRLHEFKRGDPPLIVDGERVKGSITYRTRKGVDDFKLIDYWHKSGEETARKMGTAARPIVEYDYRNKKIGFVGGQYFVDRPGIIN